MNRKYLLLLLFLTCQEMMAQTTGWTIAFKPSVGLTGSHENGVVLSQFSSEKFRHGISYGAGFRSAYRFSKFFEVGVDAEWQLISDRRTETEKIDGYGMASLVTTTEFKNLFHRIQLPVAVHFTPFPKQSLAYIRTGVMPSLLPGGKFKFQRTSNRETGLAGSGTIKADLDLYKNSELKRDLIFFAGIGIPVTKRISTELVYHFNKPLSYATFDPGDAAVVPAAYRIRGNQGLMLSAVLRLN